MRSTGIYLRPQDVARQEKERKCRRARRIRLALCLMTADAGLLWLELQGFLHPVAGGLMMALASGWLGLQLGKEEA